MYQYILIYIITINIIAYSIMALDKLKSIYAWWRISEKTLWIIAILWGVFGIWLGMLAPMYHKAGKKNFKLWIPLLAMTWWILILILLF